jgi:Zn-dependent protease
LLGGFSIGRWFGFPIRIDYSWFLIAALVVWTFSALEFPRQLPGYSGGIYYGMGVSGALLFFLSVLLHELSHSLVARARGIQIEGITLFIFGGIAQAKEEAKRPLDEFLLTIAGPLCSVALAGAFYGLFLLAESAGWPTPIVAVFRFLAILNLVLAIFNMIPGFPLDGGRIFRSVVWAATGNLERATRWATLGGRIFGYLLIIFGLIQILQFGLLLSGLWAAFIGWFLANAASSSYRQFTVRQMLSRIPVSRVMSTEPVVVPPHLTVQRLIDDYLARRSESAFPVMLDGAVLGIVSLKDATAIPDELRSFTRVDQVMRPTYDLRTVRRDQPLDEVVTEMEPGGDSSVLVLENGHLVGLLSMGDLREWVRRLKRLGIGSIEETEPVA